MIYNMTSSDIIALLATIISICAFALTFLSYRRERSKSNQDFLFEEKIDAYKKLMLLANTIFESFFDIVDEIVEYNGSKKAWIKYLEEESGEYDDHVNEFYEAIFISIPILPAEIYSELINFGVESGNLIDSAFKGNSVLTIRAHEKLEKSLKDIIGLVRNDLNVDKLNVDLKRRLK